MYHNEQAVVLLLDHGADITYTHDVYGNASHAACITGSRSTAQLLLRHGISADERGGIYDHPIFAALFHSGVATPKSQGLLLVMSNSPTSSIQISTLL